MTVPPPYSPPAAAPAAPTTPVTNAELVQKYIALQNKMDSLKERHKAELRPFRDASDQLEVMLLNHLRQQGTESMRTEAGTVFCSRRDSMKVEDGQQFLQFCVSNGRVDLLEQRVAKKACEEYLAETGKLPPGVSTNSEYVLGYRRASK